MVGTGVDQKVTVVLAGVVVRRKVAVVATRLLVVVGMVVEGMVVVRARVVSAMLEEVVAAEMMKVVRAAVVVVRRTVVDVVGEREVEVLALMVGPGLVIFGVVTLPPGPPSEGVVDVEVVVSIVQHTPASSACTQSVTPHAPR